jgi:hypothetical protein
MAFYHIVKFHVKGCAPPYDSDDYDVMIKASGVFKKGYHIKYDDEKKKYSLPDDKGNAIYADTKEALLGSMFKELSTEAMQLTHIPAWKRWTVQRMMGGVKFLIDVPPEYRSYWEANK